MKTSLTLLTAAAVLVVAPLAAQAEVTANVTLTTKYKYRGQDQSDPAKSVLPAIQGGFDFSHPSGLYLGNWNSSVGFAGGTEIDVYGGYRGEIQGFAYDAGVLTYHYPGNDRQFNTTEVYAGIGFGPVSAKYSRTVSSKYFGVVDGKGTGYLELNGGYEVAKGIKVVAHLGTTQFDSGAKNNGAVDYTDYKVGAEFDMGSGFTAGLAVAGANKKASYGDINQSRALLSLSKAL